MSEDLSKRRLGRGLAALIGDVNLPPNDLQGGPETTTNRSIPIGLIDRNPHNPRRTFPESELDDLTQSIRDHGVVQPVVVRRSKDHPNRFQIIAGERRWRAAQRANLDTISVIIRDVDDRTALELALIENIQRTDLNSIEEAAAYQQLIDEHGYTQGELASAVGKSRSHIANTLRLLKLPEKVQQYLVDGLLSAGHARCLITAEDPLDLAEKIVSEGLSVRQTEELVSKGHSQVSIHRVKNEKDADTRSLEKLLADMIGMKVDIRHGKRGGNIKIHYGSLEQLDDICRRLQS